MRTAGIGILLVMGAALMAEPAKTTIQDTVLLADGSRFEGSVTVEWSTFTASDMSVVASGRLTFPVVNGVLTVQLVPTTNASLGASYRVRYVSSRNTVYTERWYVPPSALALRLADVRTGLVSGGGGSTGSNTTVTISDVQGLPAELANRPVKAAGYVPGRVLKADGSGLLTAVTGDGADCVRVDGTAGACGSAGGGSGAMFNGATASNVIVGNDLDWIDQGSGTYRLQVASTVPRSSTGVDAPAGACTPGHTYVNAGSLYFCDSTGGWRQAGANAGAGQFPATGWTARNSANVSWTRSVDGSGMVAVIGPSDQTTLAVYCRAHSVAARYGAGVSVSKAPGGVSPALMAGVALRGGGSYRGIFLGYGGMGAHFEVSGYAFSDTTYGQSGFTAAPQAQWGQAGVELGIGDDGVNTGYYGPWQRGSEARNSPVEVCFGVQGPAGLSIGFYNWRQ